MKEYLNRANAFILSIFVLMSLSTAQAAKPYGYLFAHMTKSDYGRLYYSISSDGLNWQLLNDGKRVLGKEYRGHPDITKGHDGRYYLVGNYERKLEIGIWVSDDLIKWSKLRDYSPDINHVPNFKPSIEYKGAPKIFYDPDSKKYLITWHSTIEKPIKEDSEQFWRGMRTLYVTSKDLKTFSHPRRLFNFDLATIDVIIRKEGPKYYAIIKDEKYPDFSWSTGKTIRICSSYNLLGPYSKPSPPVSPNFREAPNLIPRPDGKGWYLYYEQYPGISYGMSTAPSIKGPWYDVYCKDFQIPETARHGCMIPITQNQYKAITQAFSKSK